MSASRHWYTSLYWFLIWNFTFVFLWPLNRRSDKEVTVDTFVYLPKANMLTPLVLPFNVVWNLTFFDLWPLNRRSDEEVTVKTFACLFKGNMLAPLVLPFDVWNLTFVFDLVTPTHCKYSMKITLHTHFFSQLAHWRVDTPTLFLLSDCFWPRMILIFIQLVWNFCPLVFQIYSIKLKINILSFSQYQSYRSTLRSNRRLLC